MNDFKVGDRVKIVDQDAVYNPDGNAFTNISKSYKRKGYIFRTSNMKYKHKKWLDACIFEVVALGERSSLLKHKKENILAPQSALVLHRPVQTIKNGVNVELMDGGDCKDCYFYKIDGSCGTANCGGGSGQYYRWLASWETDPDLEERAPVLSTKPGSINSVTMDEAAMCKDDFMTYAKLVEANQIFIKGRQLGWSSSLAERLMYSSLYGANPIWSFNKNKKESETVMNKWVEELFGNEKGSDMLLVDRHLGHCVDSSNPIRVMQAKPFAGEILELAKKMEADRIEAEKKNK